MSTLNSEVTKFLDELNHPLRVEIELLRHIILNSNAGLTENIKWNGPNYCHNNQDRLTMRIQPPKQIQLIFHRGAKKMTQPEGQLIKDKTGMLDWKENDRAVASFKNGDEIIRARPGLEEVIHDWIKAAE
ncbi:MAG: hypothetical protein FD166_3156 [Bacteroidetes bacterium]|nr:MAG: hypothetical protein FD166_3156 [Bacteroidota bacterium]